MATEAVNGRGLGLEGLALEVHVGLLRTLATLAPVAGHTGCNEIVPGVWAAAVPGNDMVQGQMTHLTAAVLACKIVAA